MELVSANANTSTAQVAETSLASLADDVNVGCVVLEKENIDLMSYLWR